MSPLPLPIRLAAGLAAIALERARKLPQDVSEWPMTAVSQALQVSMRVQQRITELAIKGDEALAGLREPEEDPPWAVFDEDLPQPTYLRPDTAESSDDVDLADFVAADVTTVEEQSWFEAIDEAYAGPDTAEAASATAEAPTASTETATASTEVAAASARTAATAEAPAETADTAEAPAETTDTDAPTAQLEDANRRTREHEPPDTGARTGGHAEGPGVLPSYPELSLASVRGRLRALTLGDLEELLAYERSHDDRPEFVRMLTNRIATVRDR